MESGGSNILVPCGNSDNRAMIFQNSGRRFVSCLQSGHSTQVLGYCMSQLHELEKILVSSTPLTARTPNYQRRSLGRPLKTRSSSESHLEASFNRTFSGISEFIATRQYWRDNRHQGDSSASGLSLPNPLPSAASAAGGVCTNSHTERALLGQV